MVRIRQVVGLVAKLRRLMRKWHSGIRDTYKRRLAGDLHLTKTPEHLLSDAALETGFVRIDSMSEETYRRSVFLDASRPGVFQSTRDGLWSVNIKELPGLVGSIQGLGRPTLHFISHPGFCGSTLMANMLEALSPFFVYREPVIWTRLARLMFDSGHADRFSEQQLGDICGSVFRLFARTWEPQQQAIIKSIPSAMGMDLYAHKSMPDVRCIYIRPKLESYVASVLKHGDHRVNWIEIQLKHEWLWPGSGLDNLRAELDSLPANLKTALHWRLHASAVKRHEKSHPHGLMTIASDDFFQDKQTTLVRAVDHLGCTIENDELLQLMQSDIVKRHSKRSSRRFDDSDRVNEEARALSRHKAEIAEAESWLSSLD